MENLELKLPSEEGAVTDLTNELLTEKKVTEKEVEASLSYDKLTNDEKKAIDEFIAKIDPKNTTDIIQFGSSAQNNISQFSDSVLDNVKTKQIGDVGGLLTNLVVEIKAFDKDLPVGDKKGLEKLFYNAKKEIDKVVVH